MPQVGIAGAVTALALVDAQTTSDRGLVKAIVAAPSRHAEGERPTPRRGL
jgi:hypothetical protein